MKIWDSEMTKGLKRSIWIGVYVLAFVIGFVGMTLILDHAYGEEYEEPENPVVIHEEKVDMPSFDLIDAMCAVYDSDPVYSEDMEKICDFSIGQRA